MAMVEARLGDLEDELAEQDKTVPGRDDVFRFFPVLGRQKKQTVMKDF